MKRIYDFSRNPAHRNYTVADLKALKGSGTNSRCPIRPTGARSPLLAGRRPTSRGFHVLSLGCRVNAVTLARLRHSDHASMPSVVPIRLIDAAADAWASSSDASSSHP